MSRERAMATVAGVGMVVCALLAAVTVPQRSRPATPIPDVAGQVAELVPRVERAARIERAALALSAAERRYVLARTRKERQDAGALWVLARGELQAAVRDIDP